MGEHFIEIGLINVGFIYVYHQMRAGATPRILAWENGRMETTTVERVQALENVTTQPITVVTPVSP